MVTINLKEFYSWYTSDEYIEVTEEVAAELYADKNYEKAHDRRMKRNKTYLSDFENDPDTAAVACASERPDVILETMEQRCRLCRALNSLPEIQGRRVEARYLLGKSIQEIAETENICESAIKRSIERGLREMEKIYHKNFSKMGCETAIK